MFLCRRKIEPQLALVLKLNADIQTIRTSSKRSKY